MYCKRCGNQLEEGAMYCSRCGNAVEFQNQNEWQGEDSDWDSTIHEKQKKRKKAPFIIGGAAAAVLVVGTVGIVSADSVSNFITKTFSSPEEYYLKVEKEYLKENIQTFTEVYDNLLKKQKGKTASDIKLSAKLEEGGWSMVSSLIPMDFSWLKEVSLDISSCMEDDAAAAGIELLLNEDKLASLDIVADFAVNEIYMRIPELSSSYFGADLTQLEEEAGYQNLSSEQILGLYSDLLECCPDGKTLEKLLNRYSDVILNHISRVSKEKETLTVGDISQKCTVLEAIITEREVYDMMAEILEMMKADKDLEKIIRSFVEEAKKLDTYGGLPNADQAYTAFLYYLQDIQNSLYESSDFAEEGNYLRSTIQVSGSGEIIGRSFGAGTDEIDQEVFYYEKPMDGKQFNMEAFLYMDREWGLRGSGTISGKKENSSYTVLCNRSPLITVELEEFDRNKLESGYLSGSVIVHLDSGLEGIPGAEELGGLLTEYALKVTFDQDKKDSSVALTLMNGELPLITVQAETLASDKKKVEFPSDKDHVYNMMSEEDLVGYMSEVDWGSFVDKLRKSDLPEELITPIEDGITELVEMMEYYANY